MIYVQSSRMYGTGNSGIYIYLPASMFDFLYSVCGKVGGK